MTDDEIVKLATEKFGINPLLGDSESCALIDKMVELKYLFSVNLCYPGPKYYAEFWRDANDHSHWDRVSDGDRRRVVALAALKAIGGYDG